ncbi:hypothetical protein KIPB_010329, partial [Kipferlia bialata]
EAERLEAERLEAERLEAERNPDVSSLDLAAKMAYHLRNSDTDSDARTSSDDASKASSAEGSDRDSGSESDGSEMDEGIDMSGLASLAGSVQSPPRYTPAYMHTTPSGDAETRTPTVSLPAPPPPTDTQRVSVIQAVRPRHDYSAEGMREDSPILARERGRSALSSVSYHSRSYSPVSNTSRTSRTSRYQRQTEVAAPPPVGRQVPLTHRSTVRQQPQPVTYALHSSSVLDTGADDLLRHALGDDVLSSLDTQGHGDRYGDRYEGYSEDSDPGTRRIAGSVMVLHDDSEEYSMGEGGSLSDGSEVQEDLAQTLLSITSTHPTAHAPTTHTSHSAYPSHLREAMDMISDTPLHRECPAPVLLDWRPHAVCHLDLDAEPLWTHCVRSYFSVDSTQMAHLTRDVDHTFVDCRTITHPKGQSRDRRSRGGEAVRLEGPPINPSTLPSLAVSKADVHTRPRRRTPTRQCPGCAKQGIVCDMSRDKDRAAFCHYSGLWYCPRCMASDPVPIPALIANQLNWTPKAVSKEAYLHIMCLYRAPVVQSQALPAVFRSRSAFRAVRGFRWQMQTLYPKVVHCYETQAIQPSRHSAAPRHTLPEILSNIEGRLHLVEKGDAQEYWSYEDLVGLESQAYVEAIQDTFSLMSSHVLGCHACLRSERACPECAETAYSWEVGTTRCTRCQTVLHTKCWRKRYGDSSLCLACAESVAGN